MLIPTIILEEHHEAFLSWSVGIKLGAISRHCTLIHFDDHSDLNVPTFNTSVNGLLHRPLKEVRKFVYEEMKIDTFILPAVHLGLIKKIIWVRQGMPMPGNLSMFVRSFNEDGKKLIAGKIRDNAPTTAGETRFEYIKVSNDGFQYCNLSSDTDVILDIDLDYFSCCEVPYLENPIIIEITKNEYEEFLQSRYHYLKYIVGSVKAIEEGGNYYYIINNIQDRYPSNREVCVEEIDKRINDLACILSNKILFPKLITICRSGFSGFTPRHQVDLIQHKLLGKLGEMYSLKIMRINEIEHSVDTLPMLCTLADN